jgi:hypothetical protein
MKGHQSEARVRLRRASLHAEDDAIMLLFKLDLAVALATACSVEQRLATKWEVEQEAMRRRRDPRKVMSIADRQWSGCVLQSEKSGRGLSPTSLLNTGSCKS